MNPIRKSFKTGRGCSALDLENCLESVRREFPILSRCIYLISNSLGAVPCRALDELKSFYRLWAEEGVSAWQKQWWNLGREIADDIASLIGAGKGQVTMMPNVTQCHWAVLSTQFLGGRERKRKKIVITDQDFPSIIYAVSRMAEWIGWKVRLIRSFNRPEIPVEKILDEIDEQTLFVATSHVYFKSACIQDIAAIASRSRQKGAMTLIDGYHGPGVIPVHVKKLDVDFYAGGCLKWLCGGPGNAFLYVRPELARKLKPGLTGWFAHKAPFRFDPRMDFIQDSYKFTSGTPGVSNLYTARAGLDIIKRIGIPQIRKKSLRQTNLILSRARERGFSVRTPENDRQRGGSVSLELPHAFQVKQALENRKFKLDFRKGSSRGQDVIRVGPHFYTTDEELEKLFEEIDRIYRLGEYKKYSSKRTFIS